jgi:ribonuclease-3
MADSSKKETEDKIFELARKIEYEFKNIKYLKEAMNTNKINQPNDGKNRNNHSNEALSTVGDALLKFIISDKLYKEGNDKGTITVERIKLEKNETLCKVCDNLTIYDYAYNDNGFENPHRKHDFYIEAIVAAIYYDKGFEYTKKWLNEFLIPKLIENSN